LVLAVPRVELIDRLAQVELRNLLRPDTPRAIRLSTLRAPD
jgi:hypothetical protein